jgi:hypothetical protein
MIVSTDGTVCVWDIEDGLCLGSADQLLQGYSPSCIASVANNRHVFVSGRSHKVAVVDIIEMKVRHWLVFCKFKKSRFNSKNFMKLKFHCANVSRLINFEFLLGMVFFLDYLRVKFSRRLGNWGLSL